MTSTRSLDADGRPARRSRTTSRRLSRALVAGGLALFVLVSALPAADAPTTRPTPEDLRVYALRTVGSFEDVLAAGATPLEAYESFVVARGPLRALDALRAAGFDTAVLLDDGTIRLAAGPVEARDLATDAGPWTRNAQGLAVGVVHVHAPFKEPWRIDFDARRIEILRYLPTNAFLVRGPMEGMSLLKALPYVDGVGPYRADWKMRSVELPREGHVDVRIVLLPGEAPEPLMAWLSHHGVGPSSRVGPGPGLVGAFGTDDFRWVRARLPAGLLPAVVERADVEFVEEVRPPRPVNADMSWVLQTNRVAANSTRDVRFWWNGLDGRGQVVGLSDTGIDYDHDAFRHSSGAITLGDLYNVTDATRRKVVRYLNMGYLTGRLTWPGGSGPWDPASIQDSDHTPTGGDCTFGHGTAVSSVLAGNDNWRAGGGGVNDGLALGAKLYLQDIGTLGVHPTQPLCPPNDEDLLNYIPEDFADLFGPSGLVYNDPVAPVRIHSNSWGSSGVNEYDIQARMVDAFVWSHPDFTVLFAAGNAGSGSGTIEAPATGKNLVTVGGAGNPDTNFLFPGGPNDVIGLSSRGPTPDGRLKPTVLGIFDGDSSMSDGSAVSGSGESDDHWGGTSYATPSAAAATAIIRQYFADGWYPAARPVPGNARSASAALVRAVLIASGEKVTGSGAFRPGVDTWPNNEQGFGRIQLSNVLPIAAAGDTFRTQVVDAGSGLVTGEIAERTFRVSGTRTLKFVLAWSDYPAAVSAGRALVNDLDLEVAAPDGTIYRGNRFGTFAQGQSVPGGTADVANVEEAVIVRLPLAGEWTVRVRASNVPAGPQPYALVATGDLDPAFGRVTLDRSTYRPGDAVRIDVEDSDATGVQVRLSSDFEPAGEMVSLGRSAPDEIWRGSAAISFGPASAAGVQVRDADVIRVEYVDASPVHTAVATARVDAVGPTIHDVTSDRPGTTSTRVRWRTSEPATSAVWYGTTATNLTLLAEDRTLRTVHELAVAGLQSDTLYYFDVASRDRHDQETRDTNGGRHYRFRTEAFGDVLLVLADDSFPPEREPSWVNALDTNGWRWSLWRTPDAGPPPLSVLQAQRVVVWQVGLEEYPPFDVAGRDLVRQYLDGGGRLLVTSHDTTWALGDSNSEFYTPEAETWVRSVLRAGFVCDPQTVGRLRGVTGDPISGPYTGGVGYLPHRDGGAVDEFTVLQVGGTTSSVWTDELASSGCGSRPVGLRWSSSGPNGTLGAGVWGGRPSRLAYFAFELTSIDTTAIDLRPTSAIRAGIIDNAIRWLVADDPTRLDRDHPAVTITAPSGGNVSGSTLRIDWTATATGAALAGFDLSYSGDAGQTWSAIATVSGAIRTYTWDVGAVPNGDRYLVRIVARDAGTPSLSGLDETDGLLSIRRAGGDGSGPTVWAGSVRVAPNPPGGGTPTTFLGTADDRASGDSGIAGAEFFLSSTEPAPQDAGSGTAMQAADGAFDGDVENLTWTDALAVAPGASCVWVHGLDAAGNWGSFESACFVVIGAGPDVTPPATARITVARLQNVRADVEVTWTKAWDDLLFGGATTYRVLRSTSAQGPGAPASGDIPATGAATYTFVDPGRGEPDSADYFYRIESVDAAGNRATGAIFAAKVRIAVGVGPNLLGMPADASDRSLSALAGGLGWVSGWAYDACDSSPTWTSAVPSEAARFLIGPGQGFWLNATAAGSLLAVGVVPGTARVDLCAGWNLVALPGFAQGVSVASVRAATGAVQVVGFDPTGPYHTRTLGDTDVVSAGQGIWVFVPAAVTWTVAGS